MPLPQTPVLLQFISRSDLSKKCDGSVLALHCRTSCVRSNAKLLESLNLQPHRGKSFDRLPLAQSWGSGVGALPNACLAVELAMEPSRDVQIAQMQATIMAARASQASLQARVLELESLLSIQQQQQVALSALSGLGPQALALAASGLLPGFANLRPGSSPLGALGAPAVPHAPATALALNWAMFGAGQPPAPCATTAGSAAPLAAAPSSAAGSGSPPQSASPRSSPSPPQRASPETVLHSEGSDTPASIAAAGAYGVRPPSHAPSTPAASPVTSRRQTEAAAPPSSLPQPTAEPDDHGDMTVSVGGNGVGGDGVGGNGMLELLCTVAGREATDGTPSSPDSGASVVHQQHVHAPGGSSIEGSRPSWRMRHEERLVAGGHADGESGGSANGRLASALAGVGAAGSLARIRQQSAALSALDGKRQRVGY